MNEKKNEMKEKMTNCIIIFLIILSAILFCALQSSYKKYDELTEVINNMTLTPLK